MDRDTEYLRERVEYLERMLEHCLSHINCLEARMAELERRPVVMPPAEEAPERARDPRTRFVEEWVEVIEGSSRQRFVTEGAREMLGQFFPDLNRPGAKRR
jgi:hypothetical protein